MACHFDGSANRVESKINELDVNAECGMPFFSLCLLASLLLDVFAASVLFSSQFFFFSLSLSLASSPPHILF